MPGHSTPSAPSTSLNTLPMSSRSSAICPDASGREARCFYPYRTGTVIIGNRSSRWTVPRIISPAGHRSSCGRVGNLVSLRILEISIQPVDVNLIREEIPAGIRRRLETILVAGGFLGLWSTRILARTVFRESLRSLYEKSGIFDRMGFQGVNVAARYAKAESSSGGEKGG